MKGARKDSKENNDSFPTISFSPLFNTFEAMNRHAFIVHGDVRIENMDYCYLIDFSFADHHAPYYCILNDSSIVARFLFR